MIANSGQSSSKPGEVYVVACLVVFFFFGSGSSFQQCSLSLDSLFCVLNTGQLSLSAWVLRVFAEPLRKNPDRVTGRVGS